MAITNKEEGVWILDEVYNKQMEGGIWTFDQQGTLWAWGANQVGELGVNTSGGGGWPNSLSSPTQVGTDSTWSKLETTHGEGNTSLALKGDGTLWMWGSGNEGELGQNEGGGGMGGLPKHRSSPVQVGTESTWSFAQANRVAVFGTKTDGTLWSWGSATYGSLGQNSVNVQRSSPTQIGTDTTWGTETYQLGGNWTIGAAIKTDGTLWMWGQQQNNGELGQNNTTNESSPKQVGTDTTWRSIGGAYAVTLATKTDGTLWAWGYGGKGGTAQNDVVQRSSPTQVGTDTTWSEVTSYGGWYSMSVTKTDGTLWNWGSNESGEAGQNNTNNGYSSPVQVPGTNWKQGDRADNGSVGAVKTDGTLWSWGYAFAGILGLNEANTKRSSPTQVGTDTNWTDVSLNSSTMLALRS